MIRIETLLSPLLGLVCLACAGTLDDPSQFEQQLGNADGEDAGAGDGDKTDTGDGDKVTPGDGDNQNAGDGDSGDAGAQGPVEADCDFPAVMAKCTGCHSGAAPSAGLDLTPEGLAGRIGDTDSNACGGALIDKADPRSSVLYTKVTEANECGQRMPVGPPLSADEEACILSWIEGL
jgi:hypothetical protein